MWRPRPRPKKRRPKERRPKARIPKERRPKKRRPKKRRPKKRRPKKRRPKKRRPKKRRPKKRRTKKWRPKKRPRWASRNHTSCSWLLVSVTFGWFSPSSLGWESFVILFSPMVSVTFGLFPPLKMGWFSQFDGHFVRWVVQPTKHHFEVPLGGWFGMGQHRLPPNLRDGGREARGLGGGGKWKIKSWSWSSTNGISIANC